MGDERRGQKTVARGTPLVPGVSRPVVGASQRQLAILVLDTSGSMEGAKIAEAIAACGACVSELADAKNRGAFEVCVISYAETAKEYLAPKAATQVRPEDFAVKTGEVGAWTNISAGLSLALDVVERPRSGNWARPVVLLLSDGVNTRGPKPEGMAAALKVKAELISVAFGSDADVALLERLSNSPQHVLKAANGADLRRHFAVVGRSMSMAARTGQNAATILGEGGVLRG
mgnify:CR=1 FL=1